MSKLLSVVLIVLGVALLFRMMFSGWLMFLILAAALAVAASSGVIGKWGYAVAGVALLLIVPTLIFRTFFMLVKLAPVLLIVAGILFLLRPSRK